MSSILEQLYNGEIAPAEKTFPKLEKYKRTRQIYAENHSDFIKTLDNLDPSLSKRFITIMDEQLDMISFEISETFVDGFCLGAKLMIEVLSDNTNSA